MTRTQPKIVERSQVLAADGVSPTVPAVASETVRPVRSLGNRLALLAMLTGLCGAVAGVATYATLAPQTPTTPMDQRTLAGGAAAVVGLIIGAAAAALVGQGVTRPALLLMQMAQRLRRGDWQARVSLPGEDELTWVGQN